jgi:hypothetical protein
MKNDYYAYAHVGAMTKEVFYVGKGRGSRANVRSVRPEYSKKLGENLTCQS